MTSSLTRSWWPSPGEREAGELIGADVLHDLTPVDTTPGARRCPSRLKIEQAKDYVKVKIQNDAVRKKRAERTEQAERTSQYLREAMDAQREVLEAEMVRARRARLPWRGGGATRPRRGAAPP